MAILRIRDENGQVHGIRALKGEAAAGVHVGSYVGNCLEGSFSSQYIDLGSPRVVAVLLQTAKGLLLVTEGGVSVDGKTVADLLRGTVMGKGENVFLSVHTDLTNLDDVTYHYVALVEEETA